MTTPRKPLIAGMAAVLVFSSGALLADGQEFRDRARVVSATPVFEQINEPRRECRTEYRTYEEKSAGNTHNTVGAILGAVAGGLLGSTVGNGNGQVAAAAVGAATGAVIGDRWNASDSAQTATRTEPVEVCNMVDNYRQQIAGYDVTYRYNDRNFTTRLPYDPGEWLSLDVRFSVAEESRGGNWKESRNQWPGY